MIKPYISTEVSLSFDKKIKRFKTVLKQKTAGERSLRKEKKYAVSQKSSGYSQRKPFTYKKITLFVNDVKQEIQKNQKTQNRAGYLASPVY